MPACPPRARLALAVAALVAIPSLAAAQSGSHGMMVMDDGESRRALHFTQPDVDVVLTPDIERADLRLLEKRLRLSEIQRDAVMDLIRAYLDDFAALKKEQAADGLRGDGPNGGDGDGEAAPNKAVNPMRAIILEELDKAGFGGATMDDLPYRPRVSVGVSQDDENPEPQIDVSVTFGGEDDSITPEVREKLQAVADKIVPRLREHVRQDMAKRLLGEGDGGSTPDDQIAKKWGELQALRERIRKLTAAKRTLYRQLQEQVQALLAEEQLERWPETTRALTRAKTLPWARLGGEGIDLIALLDEMELADAVRTKIAEPLVAYELQLHEGLVRRNTQLDEIDALVDVALYEGKYDRALSLVERMVRARIALRSLNEQYLDVIAEQLDAADARRLRREARAAAFPRIFRDTQGEQAFAAILELDDLDPDVRRATGELHEQYRLEVGEINDRLVRAIRKQQAENFRRTIERAIAVMTSADEDAMFDDEASIAADFRIRQALDARTMRTLYGMLPPEQVAGLPRIPDVDVAEPVVAEHLDERHGDE
ncbi:MAG: hypothetical protein ACYTGP_07925 [Planctomycetota bacterium]|jgi:hypothetical protein